MYGQNACYFVFSSIRVGANTSNQLGRSHRCASDPDVRSEMKECPAIGPLRPARYPIFSHHYSCIPILGPRDGIFGDRIIVTIPSQCSPSLSTSKYRAENTVARV